MIVRLCGVCSLSAYTCKLRLNQVNKAKKRVLQTVGKFCIETDSFLFVQLLLRLLNENIFSHMCESADLAIFSLN